ncbi:MAG: nuclear transport factor 2 family protein [Acidimicrobiaceae bacterium]|nr:nuclear transport factor 2 family protein [Acidimicrobiaceae bacterium]
MTEFIENYIQVWNEPDAATREKLVRLLWADDAVEYTGANEYRGHEALDARVAKAHNDFVAEGGHVFRLGSEPATHHDAVLINVEMVPAAGGPPAWVFTIVALVGSDGRIRQEYQFGRNLAAA